MKRLLLLGGFALASPCMAVAADIAVKAPPPAPVIGWTGPYIGVALGAKFVDSTWTTTQIADPPNPLGVLDSSSPRDFRPSGFRGGVYAGYNWQVAERWVIGIEGDFAWADADKTSVGVPGCTILCYAGAPGPGADLSSVAAKWDAGARLRAGYLLAPELLVYGTGGIAWQNIEASATCANTVDDPVCLVSPPFTTKTQTNGDTRVGWTIGAGIEWKVAGNWLLRGEYRYADFGTWNDKFFEGQPDVSPGADTIHYDLKVRTHIATFGIAYKFDAWAAAR